MSFRVRGRRFLITWAQTPNDVEHTDILDALYAFFRDDLRRYVVAREPHADGGTHFHAFVELSRSIDRVLSDLLHAGGVRPNVRPKRTKPEYTAAEEYCRKGEDWIEDGYEETESQETEDNVDIVELLNSSDSYTDYLQRCFTAGVPYGYAKAIRDSTLQRGSVIRDGDTPMEHGVILSPRLQFLQFDPLDDRSLVLVGESFIGKTTWAVRNAPRPFLWVRHLDKLRYVGPEIKCIVFDDMDYKHRPRGDQLNLLDTRMPAVVHLRNVCGDIPAGVHRIFTCNPGFFPFSIPDDALENRMNIVYL